MLDLKKAQKTIKVYQGDSFTHSTLPNQYQISSDLLLVKVKVAVEMEVEVEVAGQKHDHKSTNLSTCIM